MPIDIAVRFAQGRIGGLLHAFGKRAYYGRDIVRGLRDPSTWVPEFIRQMRNIGVDSVPLAVIVAAFLGGVTAFQTRYQLFPGVQMSVVGLIVRQSIVLELGPLLTALVLTGRVGARMTAEIGTMRVTEQIDASRNAELRSGGVSGATARHGGPRHAAGAHGARQRHGHFQCVGHPGTRHRCPHGGLPERPAPRVHLLSGGVLAHQGVLLRRGHLVRLLVRRVRDGSGRGGRGSLDGARSRDCLGLHSRARRDRRSRPRPVHPGLVAARLPPAPLFRS
ncbi:MAG: ABC transporter permease [Gemmatimonas sp.]